MTNEQKKASFKLSFCMALVHSLYEGLPPMSALRTRLERTEEQLGKMMDFYRVERFDKADLDKASECYDVLEEKINELYPPF